MKPCSVERVCHCECIDAGRVRDPVFCRHERPDGIVKNTNFGVPWTNGDGPGPGGDTSGGSDENLGRMSGMSSRPLTTLGHDTLGKEDPLCKNS